MQASKILVVDDQEVNLRLFEARLVRAGYQVILAQHVEVAFKHLDAMSDHELPHLIILDAVMPSINGFEMISVLRSVKRYQSIMVLMATAHADTELKARAFEMGANDFIGKPVSASVLLSRVRNLIQLGRLNRIQDHGEASQILLIKSDERDMSQVKSLLEDTRFRVVEHQGLRALQEELVRNLPDLFIIDADMAQGLAFAQTIRLDVRGRYLPILLLARQYDVERIESWNADVDDVLFKPIDSIELLARVDNLVRKKLLFDELQQSYDMLLQRSLTDMLTGVYNRAYLYDVLEREIAQYERYQRSFGILMIDIDLFKQINDSYGHQKGDAVLRAIAQLLKHNVRLSDIVSRYGGEEFAVVLPSSTREGAFDVAERLRYKVEAKDWSILDIKSTITISAGLAYCPDHGISMETLFHAADEALYEAKNSGRNKVVVYGES